MAFSQLNPVPGQLTLTTNYSVNGNQAGEGVTLQATAKNPDGTAWDATSTTVITVNMDNGLNYANQIVSYQPATTLNSHNASGINFTIAKADMTTALNALQVGGVNNGRINLFASDGTNNILVASGTWAMKYTP